MRRFLVTFRIEFPDEDAHDINEDAIRLWVHEEIGVDQIDVIELAGPSKEEPL